MIIPNIWKVIKSYKNHVPNHQPDMVCTMTKLTKITKITKPIQTSIQPKLTTSYRVHALTWSCITFLRRCLGDIRSSGHWFPKLRELNQWPAGFFPFATSKNSKLRNCFNGNQLLTFSLKAFVQNSTLHGVVYTKSVKESEEISCISLQSSKRSFRKIQLFKFAYSALPPFYSLFRFKIHCYIELYIRKALKNEKRLVAHRYSLRGACFAKYRFLNLHTGTGGFWDNNSGTPRRLALLAAGRPNYCPRRPPFPCV